jgi:HEAT repeat protein
MLFRRLGLVCLLATLGCGSQEPAPPVADAPAGEATSAPAVGQASDASLVENTKPQTAAPDAAPPTARSVPDPAAQASAAEPAESDRLRNLAAEYLQSDGSGGWTTNERVATEFEKLGLEAAPRLVPLLADERVEVRRGAAFFLLNAQFNPTLPEQVSAFTGLLNDADPTIRRLAVEAIKGMRRDDQIAAIPQLTPLLSPAQEDKPTNRAALARMLGLWKQDAAAAVEALAAAVKTDPDPDVRSACLAAISNIAAPEQAPLLLAAGLADADANVRTVATTRLRQLRAAAAPAAKELAAALADIDPRVAEGAAQALVAIGEPAVEPLVPQLAAKDAATRKLALAALAKIGSPAKAALPAIEACLADSDPQIKALAAAAVTAIGK